MPRTWVLIVYLTVLGLGLLLVALYLLHVLTVGLFSGGLQSISDSQLIFYGSGVVFLVSTYLLVFAGTRVVRLALTAVSGSSLGIHSYQLLLLFTEGVPAIVLFAILVTGVLLSFSAARWLREL
ncbi:MAG: hypothetical protein QXS20_05580 [Candidatus Thorarchaeota archaeon]